MMPMIAASTGAPFLPSASPAARAFEDDEHLLVDARADAVDREQRVPRGVSSMFSGCTSISLAPSNLRCFCVETTVPMTSDLH